MNSILGLSEPKKPNFLILFTYEHLKVHAQLDWHEIRFYSLGFWLNDAVMRPKEEAGKAI